jgi:hypothetical protein
MTEKENRAKGDDQKDYPRADDLPVHEIKSEYGAKKQQNLVHKTRLLHIF